MTEPAAPERTGVLLHVCCAPCATVAIERLRPAHDLVLFWYNPNITEAEEHEQRLREARRYAEKLGLRLVIAPYDPEAWRAAVEGLEGEPEGGRRCDICFRLRLQAAAAAARELGLTVFTTTLTLSPHKPLAKVQAAAESAASGAEEEFLAEDFKKQGGFERSTQLAAEHGLYRQDYCGCEFSRRERDERRARRRGRPQ